LKQRLRAAGERLPLGVKRQNATDRAIQPLGDFLLIRAR
jgi:hypothetical protein